MKLTSCFFVHYDIYDESEDTEEKGKCAQNCIRSETAIRLVNEVDYAFPAPETSPPSLIQRFGFLEVAMRQNDLAIEIREYLETHPEAAVVNLGCGLDSTGKTVIMVSAKFTILISRM